MIKEASIVLLGEEKGEWKKRTEYNMHKWKRFQIVTLTLTVFGEAFTKCFDHLLFYLC